MGYGVGKHGGWTMTRLVQNADPSVLPAGPVRELATHIATFMDADGGNCFVGTLRLARCMGYKVGPDGDLARGPRASLERTVAKMVERNIGGRKPCDCTGGQRHGYHWWLNATRLAAKPSNQTVALAAEGVTKQLQETETCNQTVTQPSNQTVTRIPVLPQ